MYEDKETDRAIDEWLQAREERRLRWTLGFGAAAAACFVVSAKQPRWAPRLSNLGDMFIGMSIVTFCGLNIFLK